MCVLYWIPEAQEWKDFQTIMLSLPNSFLLIFNLDVIFSGLHSLITVFPASQSKHQWSQKSLGEEKGNDQSVNLV